MNFSTEAHDPSDAVRRRHLPSEAGEEVYLDSLTILLVARRSISSLP